MCHFSFDRCLTIRLCQQEARGRGCYCEATAVQGDSHTVPMCHCQLSSQRVSGLGVTTLVTRTDQPTLTKFLHYLLGPSCVPSQAR